MKAGNARMFAYAALVMLALGTVSYARAEPPGGLEGPGRRPEASERRGRRGKAMDEKHKNRREEMKKELGITDEQEKKLRETRTACANNSKKFIAF